MTITRSGDIVSINQPTYTVVPTDHKKTLQFGAACQVHLPLGLPSYLRLVLEQMGSGAASIVADGGATASGDTATTAEGSRLNILQSRPGVFVGTLATVDGGGSVAITVTGTPGVGNILAASFPMGVGAVKWQRLVSSTWTDISGATSLTYVQVTADGGTQVRPVATTYAPFGASVNVPAPPVTSGYDIVLLIGQSNQAGRGVYDSSIDTTDSKVFQFGGYSADSATYQQIVSAVDRLRHPELGVQFPGTNLVGPGMFFAKSYAARANRKVLLVPVAWGATGVVGDGWSATSGARYAFAVSQQTWR